ncbi:MAG: protein-tyrosine sulfotransferase, partial [Oceanospirillaceae bacterium]
MDKPIFILGCTKSGTTLMRNLFDGHPDLFVIPFESHFFQNTGRGIDYSYRRTMPTNMSLDEKKQGLIDWIAFCNKRDNPIADGFSVGRLDVDKATEHLKRANVSDERGLSDAYSKAIHIAARNSELPDNVDFVEKSVENAEMSTVWSGLYPQARFVHILRNPYSNLVAMRKYGSHNRNGSFPRLQNAIQAMQNSYYWLYRNRNQISNYQVLRYDDLISDVEGSMKTLSNNLGLSFIDGLTKPTM